MLVASSFDLWQKDSFFSAAEEVQQSADILESAYRSWLKVKGAGVPTNIVDELQRELRVALGTAKWQLDEFERAVSLSNSTCRDEKRVARHRQFLVAMETQISQVEDALSESLREEGKQRLQWVNLDESERDDLAMFLSGYSQTKRGETVQNTESSEKDAYKINEVDDNFNLRYDDTNTQLCSELMVPKGDITIDIDSSCIDEHGVQEVIGTRDEVCCPSERTISSRRTMQIIIPDEHERRTMAMSTCEATPKVKGSRILSSFPVGRHGIVSWINQISQCSSISIKITQSLRISRSIQLTIALVLILFLLVSLVPYSTGTTF